MGDEKLNSNPLPLYVTKHVKGRFLYKLFVASNVAAIIAIFYYRVTCVPKERGRWLWISITLSEFFFALFWVFTVSIRWSLVTRCTFKDRLSKKYEDELPGVDIFVCTADPTKEPPTLVINTVLSLMAYDYPPHKLSVYLSDDGGSQLTLYALLQASIFAKHWLPFCRKLKIDLPRSPAVYFSSSTASREKVSPTRESSILERMYNEMIERIETTLSSGKIPEEFWAENKDLFSDWSSYISSRNHPVILKILIGGEDKKAVDVEGCELPTLVYIAREKRPQHHHNFKAGAMNALIRVSSEISNAPVILNVDCDMYSSNNQSIRDALCFLMDQATGNRIAFVQYPQKFMNLQKDDIYDCSLQKYSEVSFLGLDANGGPMYIGSGCFHRREALTGMKFHKDFKGTLSGKKWNKIEEKVGVLEDKVKCVATCDYEEGSQWGKEMGLRYGCPVEDVITGLCIQCRGWKSVYFNPKEQAGFLGLAPTTLHDTLVQRKRWAEGHLLILLSKYRPFTYGFGKISTAHQMNYSCFNFWSLESLPAIGYAITPSLAMLNAIALFPKLSSKWSIPFLHVSLGAYIFNLIETILTGGTFMLWWNAQRMWMIRRVTSYFFAVLDTILALAGISQTGFVITSKVTDANAEERYRKGIMDFGASSPMFVVLTTLVLHNLVCFGVISMKVVMRGIGVLDEFFLQILLSGLIVISSMPIYEAAFLRRDNGRLPTFVTIISVGIVAVTSSLIKA